jgi:hypothetical protein
MKKLTIRRRSRSIFQLLVIVSRCSSPYIWMVKKFVSKNTFISYIVLHSNITLVRYYEEDWLWFNWLVTDTSMFIVHRSVTEYRVQVNSKLREWKSREACSPEISWHSCLSLWVLGENHSYADTSRLYFKTCFIYLFVILSHTTPQVVLISIIYLFLGKNGFIDMLIANQ